MDKARELLESYDSNFEGFVSSIRGGGKSPTLDGYYDDFTSNLRRLVSKIDIKRVGSAASRNLTVVEMPSDSEGSDTDSEDDSYYWTGSGVVGGSCWCEGANDGDDGDDGGDDDDSNNGDDGSANDGDSTGYEDHPPVDSNYLMNNIVDAKEGSFQDFIADVTEEQ